MIESLISFFRDFLGPEMTVFFISLLPVLELRGGLLAASLLGVPWTIAAPIAVIGNLLPIPFILFFIEAILNALSNVRPIKKMVDNIKGKGHAGGSKMLEKYPNQIMIGLFFFVAIPLPGTGAWTGALIAALLGLPPKKSLLAIISGVIVACMVMLMLTYLIPTMFGFK